jgi:predicted nucleotidyltransferase component of viral defense system
MNGIIDDRLSEYADNTPERKEQRFRELLQELALYSLSAHGFFEKALFHGGTELRLVHSLPRFSEDLDFALRSPDAAFKWEPFEEKLLGTCRRYGLQPEVRRKSSGSGAVHTIMLLDRSRMMNASSGRRGYTRIRLELDTNPPAGADAETAFLDFPIPHELSVMDLSSSFALKCHALLCRSWVKGRDWFDLLWFCARNNRPNYLLLTGAMDQTGPWAGEGIRITPEWLRRELGRKIAEVDLKDAARDVLPFVQGEERASVESWSAEMFLHYLERFFTQNG